MSVLMPGGDATADRLLQLASDLVALIADKGAAQKRLADLAAATAAAEQRIGEAAAAEKAADEKRAGIERELAEHADAMLVGRQKLDADRSTYERSRAAQIAEDAATRAQTLRDGETVATKLKELNAKLAAISQAAAA